MLGFFEPVLFLEDAVELSALLKAESDTSPEETENVEDTASMLSEESPDISELATTGAVVVATATVTRNMLKHTSTAIVATEEYLCLQMILKNPVF